MGRPLKIKSVKKMEELWEEYKEECDNKEVLTHDFSSKNSKFVSAKLKRSVTYTIEGFCVFAGISRSAFYDTYMNNEKFSDIVTRMREECEVDAREKFELQVIPSQLAGLWMSKYGYHTNIQSDVNVTESEKLDDIMSQLGGEGLEE